MDIYHEMEIERIVDWETNLHLPGLVIGTFVQDWEMMSEFPK